MRYLFLKSFALFASTISCSPIHPSPPNSPPHPILSPPPPNPLPPLRPPPPQNATLIQCPLIFDGRIPLNLNLSSFDSSTSPFNPSYVKGENTSWSSILLLPPTPPSRFDTPTHKPLEVTIDNRSLFRAGSSLQTGFRRAGLLLRDDANDAGADAADAGVVTFHWSVMQDSARRMNLSHEYMNVWHEKADYSGNQFSFVGGVVLPGDGGTDTQGDRWRVQNARNEFVFETRILEKEWQNFGVSLDYGNRYVLRNGGMLVRCANEEMTSTIKVFYSEGMEPLRAVTEALPNGNGGGGQLQIGIAKKPTETETVVFDGYQESIPLRGEGQIYGGIFVEKSDGGCVSR
jgi:hypothetical protein